MVAIRLKNILPWVNHLVDRAVFLGDSRVIANRLDLTFKALREAHWDKTDLGQLVKGLRSGDVELPTAKAVLQNFRLDRKFPNSSKAAFLPLKAEPSRGEVSRLRARGITEKFAHPVFAKSLLSRQPRGQLLEIKAEPPRDYKYEPANSYISFPELVSIGEYEVNPDAHPGTLIAETLCLGKPRKERHRENLFVLGDNSYDVLEERIRRHMQPYGWVVDWRGSSVDFTHPDLGCNFGFMFMKKDVIDAMKVGALQALFESNLFEAFALQLPPPFLYGTFWIGREEISGGAIDTTDEKPPMRFLEFHQSSRGIEVTTHIDLDRVIKILKESVQIGEPTFIAISEVKDMLESVAEMTSSEGKDKDETEQLGGAPFPFFPEKGWRSLFERSTVINIHGEIDSFDEASKSDLRHVLNVAAPWQIQYGAELFLDSLNPLWIRDHPLIAE